MVTRPVDGGGSSGAVLGGASGGGSAVGGRTLSRVIPGTVDLGGGTWPGRGPTGMVLILRGPSAGGSVLASDSRRRRGGCQVRQLLVGARKLLAAALLGLHLDVLLGLDQRHASMVRGDQRPIRVGQRPADADRAHKGSRDQDPAPAAARLFILVELVAVVCLGLSVGTPVMGGLLERRRAVRRQVVSKIVATLVLLAPLLRRVGRLIVAVVRIGLRRGKVIGRPRLGGLAVIGISLRGPWDLRWDLRWA